MREQHWNEVLKALGNPPTMDLLLTGGHQVTGIIGSKIPGTTVFHMLVLTEGEDGKVEQVPFAIDMESVLAVGVGKSDAS